MPVIVDQHRTQLSVTGNLAESIVSASLASAGDQLVVLLDVPGNQDVRVTGAKYACFGGSVSVTLYVGPTVTANGTAAKKGFYNLTTGKTPTLGVYTGPTVSDNGIEGATFHVWGSVSAAGSATSVVSREAVRKLSSGGKYLIVIEALDNSVEAQAFLEWVEL